MEISLPRRENEKRFFSEFSGRERETACFTADSQHELEAHATIIFAS